MASKTQQRHCARLFAINPHWSKRNTFWINGFIKHLLNYLYCRNQPCHQRDHSHYWDKSRLRWGVSLDPKKAKNSRDHLHWCASDSRIFFDGFLNGKRWSWQKPSPAFATWHRTPVQTSELEWEAPCIQTNSWPDSNVLESKIRTLESLKMIWSVLSNERLTCIDPKGTCVAIAPAQ